MQRPVAPLVFHFVGQSQKAHKAEDTSLKQPRGQTTMCPPCLEGQRTEAKAGAEAGAPLDVETGRA